MMTVSYCRVPFCQNVKYEMSKYAISIHKSNEKCCNVLRLLVKNCKNEILFVSLQNKFNI